MADYDARRNSPSTVQDDDYIGYYVNKAVQAERQRILDRIEIVRALPALDERDSECAWMGRFALDAVVRLVTADPTDPQDQHTAGDER